MTDEELFEYLDSHNYRVYGSDLVMDILNECPQIINDTYDSDTHICTFDTTSGCHYSIEVLTRTID